MDSTATGTIGAAVRRGAGPGDSLREEADEVAPHVGRSSKPPGHELIWAKTER